MSPDPQPKPSLIAPLRYPAFRLLWIATLFSNLGTWIQSVGAAWLMTSIAPSADMVALVQAATALPTLAFSLTAGAVADIWDRRAILLVTQSWMLLMAVLLAAFGFAGMMTPGLLLALTFSLGAGNAFNAPAWQASVGELVPREQLAPAIAVNSVGFNIARSIGPAIGGLIVAVSGAPMAFLVNAITYTGVIGALVFWRRETRPSALPRERLFGAIMAGLRYTGQTPPLRNALVRAFVFGLAASSVWALLPLVARHTMGGGPLIYGLLLGALGVGAVLGAFFIARLRRLLGTQTMINVASVCFAATTLALAVVPYPAPLFLMLMLGGAAWLATLATFNTSVQISVSGWVKARALSIYLTAVFGGIAGGSWLWGAVAEVIGLSQSLGVSAAMMCASVLLSLVVPLTDTSAADVLPATPLAEPTVAVPLEDDAGPVLIRVEYRVARDKAAAFQQAMRAVRRVRRRDGATRWGLYQDVEEPERWEEVFLVDTWIEHLRQHARGTRADRALIDYAFSFHQGPGRPPVSHLIRRQPGSIAEPPSNMPPF